MWSYNPYVKLHFFCAVTRIYIPVHSSIVCYLSYYPTSSALPQTNITTKETHLYWDIMYVWGCYVYMVREFAHECVVLVLRMVSFLVNFLTLFILIATITQGWFFTVEYFHQTNILEMINAFVLIYFEDCGKLLILCFNYSLVQLVQTLQCPPCNYVTWMITYCCWWLPLWITWLKWV